MQPDSLEQLYRAKTDDELLVLEGDRDSLVPEARALVAQELAHRGLAVRRPPIHVESDTMLHLEENPAFNAPAKVGHILLALFVVGIVTPFLVAILARDLNWKQELSTVALVISCSGGQSSRPSLGPPVAIFGRVGFYRRIENSKAQLLKNRHRTH